MELKRVDGFGREYSPAALEAARKAGVAAYAAVGGASVEAHDARLYAEARVLEEFARADTRPK
jgi:hypothetical protein